MQGRGFGFGVAGPTSTRLDSERRSHARGHTWLGLAVWLGLALGLGLGGRAGVRVRVGARGEGWG